MFWERLVQVNLNILFYELDKTLQSLKDENKQLRAEMEYLKELVKGGSIAKSAPAAPVHVQTVSTPQDGLEERLTSKIDNLESSFDKFKDEMNTKENESKTRIDSLTSSLESLVTRQSEHEDRFEKAFSNLSTAPAPAPAAQSEPESSSCDISAAPVDISEQLDTIKVRFIFYVFKWCKNQRNLSKTWNLDRVHGGIMREGGGEC